MVEGPYPGVRYAACKSCGARIFWAKTTAGKAIPIDAAASPRGNLVTFFEKRTGNVRAETYTLIAHGRDAVLRTAHFATCQSADQHRRPRP